MRTTTRYPHGASRRALRATRLALAGLVAVVAALVVPGVASAATHTATVSNITVSPALAGHGGFGLYGFKIASATPGDSYPFASGDKIGHCVEATVGAGTNTSQLLTEGDLSLNNSDAANAIGAGFTTGAKRVEWILLNSYKYSQADATGVEGAAHQSAIWQLTNPSSGSSVLVGGASANEHAAAARATQLLADSSTYAASVSNAASLSIDGGADLQTCGGTSRTVTVTGAPWTDATLTLAGPGSFHTGGGATTTVDLGASGSVQVQVDSTGPGSIDVTASIKTATMVQVANGGNQDFVYLEFQTVSKKVTIGFKNCQDLTVTKTANPTFDRAFTWTIAKSIVGADTKTGDAGSSVGFDYNVVVTKGTAVDSNWKVAGTISVTNPNAFDVTGTVSDNIFVETTDTCGIIGGATQTFPAGKTTPVSYTCTFSGKPSYSQLTNRATVTWLKSGFSTNTVNSGDATLQFGTGSTGNPSTIHNSIDVFDAFNGGTPALLGHTSSSTSFAVHKDILVPSGIAGCVDVDNTATFTPTNPNNSPSNSSSVTTHVCATQKGLALSKTADPSFTRSYDWTISKSVDQTSVTTAADTATFNYTVVATKSAATDSGWMVTGTISVTNPNSYSVDNVQVTEQGVDNGGVCVLKGSGALGTLVLGQTAKVDYTCTYAALPAPAAGTNTANVTWTLPASGETPATPQNGTVTQSFVFGAPTTIVHDSVNVGDSFDGGPGAILDGGSTISASQTFTYSRSVAVPASGCRIYNNTANVTATDVPSYSKDASASVQVCRQVPPTPPVTPPTPPVTSASVPSKTTVSLVKHASSPTVKAGGTVSFTIIWKNTGKAKAKNVVICDDLPNQLTFVSAKGATFTNGKACWKRAFVAKGATLTFRVVARVDAGVGNEKLVNVATATASNAKPVTAKAPVRALRNARTRAGGVTG
jgi:uncharacterized repeat protein (TIGR01451 family)